VDFASDVTLIWNEFTNRKTHATSRNACRRAIRLHSVMTSAYLLSRKRREKIVGCSLKVRPHCGCDALRCGTLQHRAAPCNAARHCTLGRVHTPLWCRAALCGTARHCNASGVDEPLDCSTPLASACMEVWHTLSAPQGAFISPISFHLI